MNQKSIFITGAGSGIGAVTAKLFASKGWFVGLYDINEAAVGKLARELGDTAHAGHIDVTDRSSVDRAIDDFAAHTGGRMNVLCNNAGIFEYRLFHEQDPQLLEKMIAINVNGVTHCAQAAFPLLRETAGAKLVNIASAASVFGVPTEAVYASTKFFVRGLSESLKLEWKPFGIDVTCIMPAYVTTPLLDDTGLEGVVNVELTADDIAEMIWKSVHSSKLYWVAPREIRLYRTILGLLPIEWGPKLVARIHKKKGFWDADSQTALPTSNNLANPHS